MEMEKKLDREGGAPRIQKCTYGIILVVLRDRLVHNDYYKTGIVQGGYTAFLSM